MDFPLILTITPHIFLIKLIISDYFKMTGEALKALIYHGVDEKKRIIDTDAPHPFLFNLSMEMIERFRKQLSLIDLQFEGNPGLVRKAVWSCYQENPVEFRGYSLYDPGAYPEPPLRGKLTW